MATMENYDVRSNKDRVRALADYIEEIAREILASNEKLDRREMSEALIEDALTGVRANFDGLAKIIGPFFAANPQRLDDTYGLIWHLIYKSFIIGFTAKKPKDIARELIDDPEIKRYIGENTAAVARKGKTAKAQKLKDAIIVWAKENERPLATSDKFAESIRSDVRQKLGLSPVGKDWPKARTIRNAISEMKKDKTKRADLT
jgi:hypothetical protein